MEQISGIAASYAVFFRGCGNENSLISLRFGSDRTYNHPVALIVWLFDLKGLFADYVHMSIPFLMVLPLIGAGLGSYIKRPNRD
jgi:hypothetical protein